MNPDNSNLGTGNTASPVGGASAPVYTRIFTHSVAWLVLAISLAASAGGWFIARKHEDLSARKRIEEEAGRIQAALSQRMLVYQDVLHGGAGLYAASLSVERSEWHAYVEMVSVGKRFPGIDALGFIAYVPENNLEAFLKTTRDDGAPDFQVKNPGTNGDLMIVKYIEPEKEHAGLLGTDMGLDPQRRAVAGEARDTGEAAISSLVQMYNSHPDPQSGLIMMLPVYRNGAPAQTEEQRRANIEGWVFERFIVSQLMKGILDQNAAILRFQVLESQPDVDGGMTTIFDTDKNANNSAGNSEPKFQTAAAISVGQRHWFLRFTAKPAFDATIPRSLDESVALGGGCISLLLFGIALSLSSTRDRARAMAREMTTAYREANRRLQGEIKEREYTERRTAIQHSVTRVLADTETEAEAASQIVQAICESLNWDFGAYWRLDAQTRQLNCVQLWLRPGLAAKEFKDATRKKTFRSGEGLPGRVWSSSKSSWIKDVTRDSNFPRAPFAQKAGLHAAFGFPIRLGGQFLGVLEFFSREIVEPDDELLKLVDALGSQIGQFIGRKQAQQKLVHEQFLLRTLMDSLPDRIYFKDAQSRFLRNSRAHLQMFGLTDQQEALGKSDFDFFTEEHARQAFEDEQKLMQSGDPITVEEKETWPDGSHTWVLSTKMPLHDELGNVIGTFGISRDITDRKRAEETMRQAKDAAEEANRTKSQFLANMSHELRTPLNSVIGFASILLKNKGGNLNPADLNFLGRIQANGKHLLSLINEILDLSKIEAQRVELQIVPTALDVLVRETIAQQEGLVRDRPVQLLADIPPVVALIPSDAEKLRQVIINLIGNALKFTERGSVTVRVIASPENHKPVRIDVVDTGIGIPEEKLNVIFEAFQQADASTARKYGGTGLGLTISQALCGLMGFHIEVSSVVGKGSTFSVVLSKKLEPETPLVPLLEKKSPLVRPLSATLRPAPTVEPSELHGKLVLVIDDEADSRILLTQMLEEFGCRVTAVNSGPEGLLEAREHQPHLITVDLLMPGMDGASVICAIKADPQLRRIPLVVVSIVADEHRGSILGAVDILEKPVMREELLAVMTRYHFPAGASILVVDDERDSREILCSHLAEKGFEIQTAANGREALANLEKFHADLVLLDLMMPEMDGLEFLEIIRSDVRHQQLPVLIITSKRLSLAEKGRLRKQTLEFVKKTELAEASFKRLLLRVLQQAGTWKSDADLHPPASE